MGDWQFDNESAPTAGASGTCILFFDTTTKKMMHVDDAGNVVGRLSRNFSTASQGAGFATDTYVTNSGLVIPTVGLQAGMVVRWIMSLSKTAAGVAAAIVTIRLGANQTTADTAILTLTQTIAQAATATAGLLTVTALLRNGGASAVLAGGFGFAATTNFGDGASAASAAFDSTSKAGQFFGISINGGTSAAWTLTSVHAELLA